MLFKTFFIFFAVFFCLQGNAQFVDRESEQYKAFYFENEKLSSEGLLEKGKPNGYWISYYENGLRKSEGNRADFELDGVWKFYKENGNIDREIAYKNGKKEGKLLQYSNTCFLAVEENYKQGILHGNKVIYFPDSSNLKFKSITPFIDGMEEGLGFEYAKDGRIISLITYSKGFVREKELVNRKNQQGNKEGIWKQYYVSFRLKKEERFKNGLLNGYVKYYNPGGKLDSAILYLEGERQNKEQNVAEFELVYDYFPTGKIKQVSSYNLAGKKDGVTTVFSESGEILETIYFSNGFQIKKGLVDRSGLEQGTWESFYLSGELQSKGEYKNGKKVGKWQHYFRTGTVEQEGFYDKAGRYTGLWKWYYEDGKLLRSEEFRMGIEDGELEEYDSSGKLISKGEFIDGEKEGEWFYELNDHREEGKYRYGFRNGMWYFYYPNDKKSFEGSYIDGEPEGKHKYYYESGVLEKEEYYEFGKREGKWKWYDENGFETLNIQYKNGVEKKIDGKRIKETQ